VKTIHPHLYPPPSRGREQKKNWSCPQGEEMKSENPALRERFNVVILSSGGGD